MLICYCCFYSVKCSFEICVTKAIFERFSEWGTMSHWVFTVIGKINFRLECLNKAYNFVLCWSLCYSFHLLWEGVVYIVLGSMSFGLEIHFGCSQIDCCQIAYIYFVQCQFFFLFSSGLFLILFIYCSSQIASLPLPWNSCFTVLHGHARM